MYKRSLILLFTIACVNSSFGGNNSTDSKLQCEPVTVLESELYKALAKVDPADAALYLTLQQELNKNNAHETRTLSKQVTFFTMALVSTAGGFASALYLKDQIQMAAGVTAVASLAASLVGMGFAGKGTPYSDKNTEILKKMESINFKPRK